MVKENLSAPGKLAEWIDASQVALDSGEFTKIKLNRKGDVMTADYGADHLSITFGKKDQQHISLKLECTEQQVLDWYKSCVADVIKHPEKYDDYYEDDNEPEPEPVPQPKEHLEVPPIVSEIADKLPISEDKISRFKGLLTKTWFMVAMMVIIPPFGLYLFFKQHRVGIIKRILTTIVVTFYFLFIWLGFLGINTGFGIGTIQGWISGIHKTTQQKVDNVVETSVPTPTVNLEPDDGE